MNHIAVVINPISGGGRGKKVWRVLKPGLNAIFDRITFRISNHVDDLSSITQKLLSEDPDFLLIIGGDGTLNHVINGAIDKDELRNPNTKIAFFNAGCGGDFVRLFPKQNVTEFLDRLSHNQFVKSNVGKVSFPNKPARYFINIASCGLSGYVVLNAARSKWLKKLGGTINYLLHSLSGLFTYNKTQVTIQIDETPAFECSMLMLAVCNGQYFGGRMHVAPMARIDDGLLDVVLFRDYTKWDALIKLHKIYSGNHLLEKNVHYIQAKKITIVSLERKDVEIETDGESSGQLPAVFEILDNPISIIV